MTLPEPPQYPPAICLLGPTASGKTRVAVELVQRLPCEIISVDSALVYRGMDIGTAKPDTETLRLAPHHLIDIRDPAEPYSAADFRRDALREMANITARGKVPLLVGGTMLYFKALIEGLDDMPATNPAIRAAVMAEAAQRGWPAMHTQLAEIDPVTAARLHPNHSQRIGRAIEVYRATGFPLSYWHGRRLSTDFPYRLLQIALIPEPGPAFDHAIASRFEAMMAAGFLDEVAALLSRGDLNPELPSQRAVGYREAWQYLGGSLTREEMVARAIISTRQLAKRQRTWLRRWPGLQVVPVDPAIPQNPFAGANGPDSTVAAVWQQVRAFLGNERGPFFFY